MYWKNQPVKKEENDCIEGEIDSSENLKLEKNVLPDGYEWDSCYLEELCMFLKKYYIRDSLYAFDYPLELLKLAIDEKFVISIRNSETKIMHGCITGVPSMVNVNGTSLKMIQINFLCIDNDSRSKGFAPLLINEISRRAREHNIRQAVYTIVKRVSPPLTEVRYWHRLINVKKLNSIGFSKAREIPNLVLGSSSFREMTKKDIPRVTRMLQKHLRQFKLYLEIDEKYVENWLLPRKDVMYSYISDTTDQFLSFYSIPYVHVESGSVVKQAYTFYNVGNCLKDAIIMARNRGFDVYNCTDIGVDEEELVKHKFVKGTGTNNYYLYNWNIDEKITPKDIGFTLV